MPHPDTYCFLAFRLDLTNGVLWRESTLVPLRPKTFAVLGHLLAHAGEVVTRHALLATIWGTTTVGAQVLRASIRELRQVLDDNAVQPRFIETVPGRGWRFIAEVVSSQHSVASREEENQKAKGKRQKSKGEQSSPALRPQHPTPLLVGREPELAQLHQWLDKARNGERQIIFVTGEPGIGKTALIEEFLCGVRSREAFGVADTEESQQAKGKGQKAKVEDLSPAPNTRALAPVLIGRGQCIEHHGPGEAYLPVLEALERLAGAPDQEHVLALLRRYAPMWLVQMPSLLAPQEHADLQQRLAGTSRERMLRELAVFLELLTQDAPLVLVLEDLHWADVSTIELLAYVARRREPARLLLLGTYRLMETMMQAHPLRDTVREVLGHHYGRELRLPRFDEAGVATYLATRFPQAVFPVDFPAFLQQRSGGNPLFLGRILEEFLAQQLLTNGAGGWRLARALEELPLRIPATLEQLLTKQSNALSPAEQQVLQAGSVAGAEFSVAVVVAAIAEDLAIVEERCEGLVRRQAFLRRMGTEEWPDGTVAARYRFAHALYQQLWHEQVTVSHRQQWHQRIGLRKEAAYNGRAAEIATELAAHFEEGRDYPRAIQYHQQAGAIAFQRHAYQEAVVHFTTALNTLRQFPTTPEGTAQELSLCLQLALPLRLLTSPTSPQVEALYRRACDLGEQVSPSPELFQALSGIWEFYGSRGETRMALTVAKQGLQVATQLGNSSLILVVHVQCAAILVASGQHLAAWSHLEQSLALYRVRQNQGLTPELCGWNWEILGLGFAAVVSWFLGYPEQMRHNTREALSLLHAQTLPSQRGWMQWMLTNLHQLCRAPADAEEAITTMQLAETHKLASFAVLVQGFRGWAVAQRGNVAEGLVHLEGSVTAIRAMALDLYVPQFLALLAETYGMDAQSGKGMVLLDEALALVQRSDGHYYEAEIYRLKGELTLQKGTRDWELGAGEKASQKAKGKAQKAKVPSSPQPLTPSTQAEVVREVEGYFFKAIDIARTQHAKSLELRATLSLARLWQQQGKAREAYQMLSAVYDWFTEGFDTKDLQEAKALLEELSQ